MDKTDSDSMAHKQEAIAKAERAFKLFDKDNDGYLSCFQNKFHKERNIPTDYFKKCLWNWKDILARLCRSKLLLEVQFGEHRVHTHRNFNSDKQHWPEICEKYFLSFPQKIHKLRQLSWMMKVPNGVFDIIVNFAIQKLKSKHTSLKKYTNWDKLRLYSFLSFWEFCRNARGILQIWGFSGGFLS